VQENEKRNSLILDIQKTFDTGPGKKTLAYLSKLCNENEPTYVDHNPNGSAYKEGQRSIILNLRKMLAKDPNEIKQEHAIS
jgi:hypothetical protein